jgi:hypothetical protein
MNYLTRLLTSRVFDVAPEGAPGGTPPPAGAPPAAPWYTGKVSDPEVIGHWQNLGWHDKPAEEIAQLATKAHREAQKYIGVPANQIVRLPSQEGDSAGWKSVFQRLGAPSEAKDYDFTSIKHAGDTPLDSGLDTALRSAMLEANLPKSQAGTLAKGVVKYLDGIKSTEMAEKTAKLQEEKASLEKNWGLNLVANRLVAANAAKALGVSDAAVQALENTLGYAQVMEMFRNIGSKIGEDKFISSPQGGMPGVMTKDQAVARRGELMADTEWRKSYLNGDSAKAKEMTALIALIAG